MFQNIEKHLNLHTEIQIIYVVDRYTVILYNDDCTKILAEEEGISIFDALDNLDTYLENRDIP